MFIKDIDFQVSFSEFSEFHIKVFAGKNFYMKNIIKRDFRKNIQKSGQSQKKPS